MKGEKEEGVETKVRKIQTKDPGRFLQSSFLTFS